MVVLMALVSLTRTQAQLPIHMGIKNLSFVMYVAQRPSPGSLDMLVLVGEVRMQAGLHTIHTMLHKASW